jgi:hypothetical protein
MRNHTTLNFLVFTCFLLVGYTFSTRFYQTGYGILPSTIRLVTAESQNSIDAMNNGQRSILAISATSIDTSNPQLQSIWLVTYFTSNTTIQLLPIYPSGGNLISGFEKQLDHSFDLNKKNGTFLLDQEFIQLLEENNYWWSGYLIFDEAALTEIFTRLGGIELNGKKLSGEQALNSLPEVLDNPHDAFSFQVAILQSACHKFMEKNQDTELSQIISPLPDHILTDLDFKQLQMELETLYSSGHNLNCRFPTLEITRIER